MANVCVLDDAWVRHRIVQWFTKYRRDLPWRETHDPYKIWISEIMLQQTQVATVIDYYHRFLSRFPHVQSLASATEQEVLQYWSGLGYYRRARNLHLAARQIMLRHAGVFPQQPSDLQQLAGIGRYTAGAIASFAFDLRSPILETNTIRLLSRFVGMTQPVQNTSSLNRLWEVAECLLPRQFGSGKLNQAMMELGSLVCTPKQPKCKECPLRSRCFAHQRGMENQIPVLKPKAPIQPLTHVGLLILDENKRLLLRQNAPGQWWEGLWDLPWIETKVRGDKTMRPSQYRSIQEHFEEKLGLACQIGSEYQIIRHAVTRFRVLYRVYVADLLVDIPKSRKQWQWASINNMPPVAARLKKLRWNIN